MEPAPRRTALRRSRTARPSACCATSGVARSSQNAGRDTRTPHACYTGDARIQMIDSHVHLDAEQYPDPSGAIKRALDAGVTAMVVPGVGPASNRKVMDLARKFPGIVYPAIGFHPERFEQTDLDADAVLDMIARERDSICAVGEVGLPWYGEQSGERAKDADVD